MSMQLLGQVQPQLDVMSAAIVLFDDPIALLSEIDAILAQLPLKIGAQEQVSVVRGEGLALVADHGGKIRRALAGVGAVPDQLAQLGEAAHDEAVRTELTLLTREAGWQLRTLGREARRRWRTQAGESYPAELRQWLDRIDALLIRLVGQQDSVLPPEDAPPAPAPAATSEVAQPANAVPMAQAGATVS